jgi:hypothetical protein
MEHLTMPPSMIRHFVFSVSTSMKVEGQHSGMMLISGTQSSSVFSESVLLVCNY